MSDARLIGAITYILTRNGQSADPTVLAAEIVTAIRGHGWLPPTPQPAPPVWSQPRTTGAKPTPEYHAARAKLTRQEQP